MRIIKSKDGFYRYGRFKVVQVLKDIWAYKKTGHLITKGKK